MCMELFEDGPLFQEAVRALWCKILWLVLNYLTHIREGFLPFSALISVEKVANESQKTPRDVVMMENFHHIFATLSRLKISCLEAEKKEAKQKYTDHLQSYVIYSLGQPLEKLNVNIFLFHVFMVLNPASVFIRINFLCTDTGMRTERRYWGSCQHQGINRYIP